MATWGDHTCQRFKATAVEYETGFSQMRVWHSNQYAVAPHLIHTLCGSNQAESVFVDDY